MKGNKGVCNAPPDLTSKNKITLNMNEARIVPHPIMPVKLLESVFLKSPFSKKPSKGKSGTR